MAEQSKHMADDTKKKKKKKKKKESAHAKSEVKGSKPKSSAKSGKTAGFLKDFFSGTKKQVVLRSILALIAIGALSVLIMIGVVAVRIGTINMESLYQNIERSSNLYDISGEQIDTLHYTQDRTIVSIDEMPEDLRNSFIAIEDKTFYKHHGFNFRRMFGAVLSKLLGRSEAISGTSTITQQLARNVYLSEIKSQRSIHRKLSEMFIAWRLEQSLTKDEILEAYLNTIYLGYGNYGVGAASRTYFSKDVKDLDLAECAALAALPQAPDAYALITTEPGEDSEPIEKINYYTLDSIDDSEEGSTVTYTPEDDEDEDEDAEDGEDEGTGYYSNDVSKDRRDLVLSLMEDQGFISQEEADSATVAIADILEPSFEKSESAYTYFTDYVSGVVMEDLIDQYKISEEEAQRMVYTGGLEIYTTLNSDVQNAIYKEFKNDSNFPVAVDGSEVQASMVVTEVGTGYISGMVGGRDASGSQLFNRAVSPRQPGSSIKPLAVYGAALQKSYEYASKNKPFPYVDYGIDRQGDKYWGDYITASSVVIDEPLKVNGEEWPRNFTKSYSGRNTLRTALQQSINTCAVKILWQVGLDYSAELLEKYGLTTLVLDQSEKTNDVNPAALALGAMTYGVTPLEMSLAYATFPNGGSRNTAVCYTKVEDSSGKKLLTGESESIKVIDEGVAWIMTDLLQSVVSRGIAGNAAISGVKVGGKTGTTNDTFDVWFDGFTPDYSGALWIGTDLNVEMIGGSNQAAALWSRIMRQVPGITEGEYLEMPSNVVKKNGEYYTSGTEKNTSTYKGDGGGKKQEKTDAGDNDTEVDTDTTQNSSPQTVTPDTSGSSSGGGSSSSGGGSSGGGSSSSGGGQSGGGDSGGQSGGGDSGGQSGGGDSGGQSGGGDSGGQSGGDSGGQSGGGDSGSTGGGDSGSTGGGETGGGN